MSNRDGSFTLCELISHDLKQAAFCIHQRKWREPICTRLRRCGMYMHSALSRPFYHWRKK